MKTKSVKYFYSEFAASADGELVLRLGEFVEKLLKDGDYFGTRLPRIPTLVERELKEKLIACSERKERREWNLENIAEFTEGSILSVFSNQVAS